jgi:hypothetical protein
MISQYEVMLFDTGEEEVQAVVPAIPGCEAHGATDAEALTKVREVLSELLRRVRWTTVDVELMTPKKELLPFSDEQLEEIAARGPEHPHYFEAFEAVANRFNAFLERKGYTLKQMLADLPATRQALWEQKYSPLLQKARKAKGHESLQVTDE